VLALTYHDVQVHVRYTPCNVDHSEGVPGVGTFQLHKGIHHRLAETLVHDNDPYIAWTDIPELVIGRVRNTSDCKEPDVEHTVLSLNLLSAQYVDQTHDDRCPHAYAYELVFSMYR